MADGSAAGDRLTALMVSRRRIYWSTVSPFAGPATPEKLPSPRCPGQEGPGHAAASPDRFAVGLWVSVILAGARNGVGLSPVSVISPCEQVTPPITPRVREHNRIPPSGDFLSSASACVSAWHPREAETRPLPPCPCLAPSPPPVTGRRWLRTFPKESSSKDFWTSTDPPR